MAGREVEDTADLHLAVRQMLTAQFPNVPPQQMAGALCYEIASLLAKTATSQEVAHRTVQALVHVMHEQLDRLGIGHEHP